MARDTCGRMYRYALWKLQSQGGFRGTQQSRVLRACIQFMNWNEITAPNLNIRIIVSHMYHGSIDFALQETLVWLGLFVAVFVL